MPYFQKDNDAGRTAWLRCQTSSQLPPELSASSFRSADRASSTYPHKAYAIRYVHIPHSRRNTPSLPPPLSSLKLLRSFPLSSAVLRWIRWHPDVHRLHTPRCSRAFPNTGLLKDSNPVHFQSNPRTVPFRWTPESSVRCCCSSPVHPSRRTS